MHPGISDFIWKNDAHGVHRFHKAGIHRVETTGIVNDSMGIDDFEEMHDFQLEQAERKGIIKNLIFVQRETSFHEGKIVISSSFCNPDYHQYAFFLN